MDKVVTLLEAGRGEECVAAVEQQLEQDPENPEVLSAAVEVFFTLGLSKQAIECLDQLRRVDPAGKAAGPSHLLWAAQLAGGQTGISLFQQGLELLKVSPAPKEAQVAALLGMIEIYMTDLCMLDNAEQECERLISQALLLDNEDMECWSVLGSIRISQSRTDDARDALLKSYELFSDALDEGKLGPHDIEAVLRLVRSLLEVELLDEAIALSAEASRLDDLVGDVYYLNALAHYSLLQKLERTEIEGDKEECIAGLKDALELLFALPEVDPEVLEAAKELQATAKLD